MTTCRFYSMYIRLKDAKLSNFIVAAGSEFHDLMMLTSKYLHRASTRPLLSTRRYLWPVLIQVALPFSNASLKSMPLRLNKILYAVIKSIFSLRSSNIYVLRRCYINIRFSDTRKNDDSDDTVREIIKKGNNRN